MRKLLLWVVASWNCGVYGAEPAALRLATGVSYKPAIDFHLPGGGPLVENVRQIFQDMGFAVKIESMPWKRAYLETQKANYMASFPWYKDDEREKDFYFSEPLYIKPTVAVIRKNWNVPRLTAENIIGKATCDTLGSTIWNQLRTQINLRQVYVNEMEQCHQMLVNGRIDFMLMHPDLAAEYARQGLKVVDNALQLVFSGHLIISRQTAHGEEQMQRFNRSLKKLMDAKSLHPIFAESVK